MVKSLGPTIYQPRPCFVAEGYKCTKCNKTNCKLWREYQTSFDKTGLYCAICACNNQNKPWRLDRDGRRQDDPWKTDQIGWLMPAVPTEDGESFWGYSSVPPDACEWWRKLDTY
jgi:hypothetical protein